ncbi:MAG: T9SS type A sorting domain-containing protein [Calditrichaeota bacterium]|nr:T9SS type A sorting domain-containing protein [Calditrichota bacterium]
MRKLYFLPFLMLLILPLFATTYHTIVIDGSNDFDTATEQFTTTSGSTALGYITWDADYLYFGFSGSSPAGSITDANRVYHIYIDTDPQTNPKTGNGTTDGETWRWDPALPFNADYHYAFKTVNNSIFKRYYNGSFWTDATFGEFNWKGSGYWEVRISRTDIGSPSQIYVLAYAEEDWDGGYICAGMPDNLFINTNVSGLITFNDHWLGFTLTTGVTPNDANNTDNSLPVTLSAFNAFPQNQSVIIKWTTQSEIDVLGYEIQRSLDKNGAYATIADYQNNSGLKAKGSTSAKTQYQFEDKDVLFGFTYWYKLISHDLDGSQEEFGPVQANLENQNDAKPVVSNIPNTFSLEQNFPNPFNSSTEIVFSVPESEKGSVPVELSVFNLKGQKIANLVNGVLSAGTYRVNWNGRDFNENQAPTGIYFYKLNTGDNILTRKMLMVK